MRRSTDKFHRQDFKIPIDLYQRLQEIAVKHFSAKIHHRSNKPEITSTLISLLQLGIESLENSDEPKTLVNRFINSDKGKPITFEQCQAMIDSAISQLRLELISPNTDGFTDNITDTKEGGTLGDRPEKLSSTDKQTPIVNTDLIKDTENEKPIVNTDTKQLADNKTNLKPIIDTDNVIAELTDKNANDKPIVNPDTEVSELADNDTDIKPINDTDTKVSEFADNDTGVKSIVNTDKKSQDNIPVDTDNITEVADKSTENTDTNGEVLPYMEAVKVIKRLHRKGFSYTKIASQLRDKYYTKSGESTNWQGIQVKRELVKK